VIFRTALMMTLKATLQKFTFVIWWTLLYQALFFFVLKNHQNAKIKRLVQKAFVLT
jgi:hypothetical protein